MHLLSLRSTLFHGLSDCIDARKPLDGFIVNVPKNYRLKPEDFERPAWLPKYLNLANGDLYCRERGFLTE